MFNILQEILKNLYIYKASAGSGKTHALTSLYLKLAFSTPDNFAKILAVTFTNKAAEEMKERIISELYNIIKEGKNAAHYEIVKNNFKNKTEQQIRKIAQTILDNILHNYSSFAVSTIDSFVQKVIRAFSYEIGIQSGYQIEMDNDKVIAGLTEKLYEKLDINEYAFYLKKLQDYKANINDDWEFIEKIIRIFGYKLNIETKNIEKKEIVNQLINSFSDEMKANKELLNWLIRFAEYKIAEGKNWDFREEIKSLSREIFKERFQSFAKDIGNEEDVKQLLKELYSEILNQKFSFEKKMREIADTTKKIIKQNKINPKDLGAKFKAIANYLTNKINPPFKFPDLEPNKTVNAALDGMDNWHAKSAKKEIIYTITGVFESLYNCLENATNAYQNESGNYLNAKVTLNNFHSFGILNDIASLLPEYREENNLLLISDTTQMLKDIINGNDAHFIYEKVGNRYKHILIDEFQDTSGFQWENFRPLITNSLSEGNFNLIVGDIKQSIYRWRGGDWNLLRQEVEKEVGSSNIKIQNLETNWRSRKNIIDFNNSLFESAANILQAKYNEQLNEINDKLALEELVIKGYHKTLVESYSDSYQFLPQKFQKAGGRVKVQFFNEKGSAWKESVGTVLPQTIDELIIDKGYRAGDIAILVRKNGEGKAIVDMLLNHRNENPEAPKYDIISAESLFISNSPAVKIIIAAMQYLLDKNNLIELSSLILEFKNVGNLKQSHVLEHNFFKERKDKKLLLDLLPKEFIEKYTELTRMPIFELCEMLIEIFGLGKIDSEYPFIRSFQDEVLKFIRNGNSNMEGFLDYWNEHGNKISIQLSESLDALQIMTIHKSKGLAFKVVIVPYCDWKLDHSTMIAPVIWCEPNKKPYNNFSYLPIKYGKDLANTIYRKDFFEEKLSVYVDALNMLYVAFTRPKEELIVFAPEANKEYKQISDIILSAIENSSTEEYEIEEKKYLSLCKFYDKEKKMYINDTDYNPNTKKVEENNENYFLPGKYHNVNWREKLEINMHSEDFFIESIQYIEDKVNYGTLMHDILARIKTPKDIEAAIEDLYFAGRIAEDQKEIIEEKINEIVLNSSIKDWFSEKWQVIAEKSLLTAKGETKIPDRIVFNNKETIVIDFKFGGKQKKYKEQVLEYMQLVKDVGYKEVRGFLYYANTDKKEEVFFNE